MNTEKFEEFYKRYPDLFLENFFNLKIPWYKKIFLRLTTMLDMKLQIMEKQLKDFQKEHNEDEIIKQWNLETGEKFNDIINRYAINEEELLSISETVAKFVTITRKTNIDDYLFIDKEMEIPIIKYYK